MILADASVWINHLRLGEPRLADLLNNFRILIHPMVIGELACGNLKARKDVLDFLNRLPRVPVADHEEVLGFIEHRRLMGRGIGFINAHLPSAAALAGSLLWTHDARIEQAAVDLGLALT